jgi:hypothetical protein
MYTDALEYLEEERDEWTPFEALFDLPDDVLQRPTEPEGAAHGWTGRELIAHVVGWQEIALAAATELAVNDRSPTADRFRAFTDEQVDDQNIEIHEEWAALAIDEVRQRARTVAGNLRGHLTVVPETRWLKHPQHMRFFVENTIEHYAEHQPELQVILAMTASGAE